MTHNRTCIIPIGFLFGLTSFGRTKFIYNLFFYCITGFVFLVGVNSYAQERKVTTKKLFSRQLLFIEKTENTVTDLLIYSITAGDSVNKPDTVYHNSFTLSWCDIWEGDYKILGGTWELHKDTLILWHYEEATFGPDAGHIDPPSITSTKQIYVIRKNFDIILSGVYYGHSKWRNINPVLHNEIKRKTSVVFQYVSKHFCF